MLRLDSCFMCLLTVQLTHDTSEPENFPKKPQCMLMSKFALNNNVADIGAWYKQNKFEVVAKKVPNSIFIHVSYVGLGSYETLLKMLVLTFTKDT